MRIHQLKPGDIVTISDYARGGERSVALLLDAQVWHYPFPYKRVPPEPYPLDKDWPRGENSLPCAVARLPRSEYVYIPPACDNPLPERVLARVLEAGPVWEPRLVPASNISQVLSRPAADIAPRELSPARHRLELTLRRRLGRGGLLARGARGQRFPVPDRPDLYPVSLLILPGMQLPPPLPPLQVSVPVPSYEQMKPKKNEPWALPDIGKLVPKHSRAGSKFPHPRQPERQPVPDNPLYDPARADPNMPSFD